MKTKTFTKKELVEEHTQLVKRLKGMKKGELQKEAKVQEDELREYKRL